jgi:hypothetical protein
MDLVLMLHGVSRWCGDCGARTIYLPVAGSETDSGPDGWCCTACDAAVVLPSLLSSSVAA